MTSAASEKFEERLHAGHQTSSMRCLWTTTDRTACHFRNLYFDTHTSRFAFFSPSSLLHTQSWQLPNYMASKAVNPVSHEEVELARVQPVKAEKQNDGCAPAARFFAESRSLIPQYCVLTGSTCISVKVEIVLCTHMYESTMRSHTSCTHAWKELKYIRIHSM